VGVLPVIRQGDTVKYVGPGPRPTEASCTKTPAPYPRKPASSGVPSPGGSEAHLTCLGGLRVELHRNGDDASSIRLAHRWGPGTADRGTGRLPRADEMYRASGLTALTSGGWTGLALCPARVGGARDPRLGSDAPIGGT